MGQDVSHVQQGIIALAQGLFPCLIVLLDSAKVNGTSQRVNLSSCEIIYQSFISELNESIIKERAMLCFYLEFCFKCYLEHNKQGLQRGVNTTADTVLKYDAQTF